MAPALLAVGLLLLSLPAAARPLGRRVSSAEWARLSTGALFAGVVLVEVALALVAAPTLLSAVGSPALAQACERLVGPLMPLGDAGGWTAGFLAIFVAGSAVSGWRRAHKQSSALAIERLLGDHQPRGDHVLVVLPTPERVAYSVDHLGPQVVVSQGLLDTLPPRQLDAVIDHERAHLRLGHPRLLRAGAAARHAVRWWPPARRSHAAFRVALERRADDVATPGDEARKDLRDALLTLAVSEPGDPVAAFSLADATIERIEAMERPAGVSSGMHLLLYVPGVAGALVVMFAAGSWLSQARLLVAMAGRCTV